MSMSICSRSGRKPFAWFLYVGGNSETRLNQMVPGRSTVSTKRAFAVAATSAVDSVTSNCFHAGVRRLAVVALNRGGDRSAEPWRGLRVEGGAVARVGPDRDAPEALVGDTGGVAARRLGHLDAQAGGDGGVERLILVERDRRNRAIALDRRPVRGRRRVVEERAIPYQLGIQAAVVGVVDLLRHQAIQQGTDLARRRGGVDRDRRRRGARNSRSENQHEHERTGSLHLCLRFVYPFRPQSGGTAICRTRY